MTSEPANQDSTQSPDRPGPVLVTGAFGLVGSQVIRALADAGFQVVATDLDLPANRKIAGGSKFPKVAVRWADLTIRQQVDNLLQSVKPAVIIHLAAVIAPACYSRRELARKVNVDATAKPVESAAALPEPPRFVQASSIAVYGSRNPHNNPDPLTPDTPVNPTDLYGTHKAEAEELVRASGLEWAILRLGGVLTAEEMLGINKEVLVFEAAIPADGRLQTVDVRDVAAAFVAATTTTATGEVFLIGGDETHRLRQGEIGAAIADASGLTGGIPQSLPGNPDSDDDWFATDWMDTTRSQEVLGFQHHSWPDLLAQIRSRTGVLRYLVRPAAPLVRLYLKKMSPYKDSGRTVADPWTVIAERIGDPTPDKA